MKIYLTKVNADLNEGRGPMVNDLAFKHKEDAMAYIDYRPGVMGRSKKWSEEKYSDWIIEEIEVREHPYNEQHEAKLKILAKLTKEERKILGLD